MKDNRELTVSPEEGGRYLGYGYGGGMHATGPGYACGLHLMAVLPDAPLRSAPSTETAPSATSARGFVPAGSASGPSSSKAWIANANISKPVAADAGTVQSSWNIRKAGTCTAARSTASLTKQNRIATIYPTMKGGGTMSIKKLVKTTATTCKCKSSC